MLRGWLLAAAVLGPLLVSCDGPRGRAADAPPRAAAATTAGPAEQPLPSAGASVAGGRALDGGRPTDAAAPPATDDRPKALTASAALVDLAVEGFPPAVVSLPLGARSARPVVVATHGNFDHPGWQCEQWRAVVQDRAFVLCPRGTPRPDSPAPDDTRFTYGSNLTLEQELDAALAALKARYPDHVAEGEVLYTGFSLGAIMGVVIASRRPSLYPRLVLVEGGFDRWTAGRARAFADGGGRKVLFVCGQKGCELAARGAAKLLERRGVATRVELVPRQGHSYGGPMNEPIRQAWDWLLEGDERWSAAAR